LGGNCGLDQKEVDPKISAWRKECFSNPNEAADAIASGAAALSKVDSFVTSKGRLLDAGQHIPGTR
jgi:hypothetical protein